MKNSLDNTLYLAIANRENWKDGFQGLVQFLSQKLKQPIELIVATDFKEVQELVQQHKAAFGIFTSTGYVNTKKVYTGLKYLATGQTIVGNESRSYYNGLFIVRRDSSYKSISDLMGESFAFVSPSSSSGYKYPLAFFHSHAINIKTYFSNIMFLGDHSYVTDAVATGVAAGGVTWDLSLSKAISKHGDAFRIIGEYGPIVNHAFVAGEWVEESLCQSLMELLVNLPDEVTNGFGFPYSGFEILSDSAYDMAREVEKMEQNSVGEQFIERYLTLEEFKTEALEEIVDLLREIRITEESKLRNKFIKREPTPLICHRSNSELVNIIKQQFSDVVQTFPKTKKFVSSIKEHLKVLFDQDSEGAETLSAFQSILKISDEWRGIPYRKETGEFVAIPEANRIIYRAKTLSFYQKPDLVADSTAHIEESKFITLVTTLNERLRQQKLSPTPEEKNLIRSAYQLLKQGANVKSPYKSLGISGFRDIHTLLFNTNPGEGHIGVTCMDLELMKGAPVHIEHIDRDKEFNKEKVEPYRLPAIVNAAKVRLHVGSHSPCTCYIGRPVFENNIFTMDLLKSVHLIASACTAMFMNGIVDCKISMERMTATEAIQFMQCTVGNVIRNRNRQYLSAAFNINTPIVDDRAETLNKYGGAPATITDKVAIARLAIQITKEGGFERVTWDGASNEVPSLPIIEQLTHEHLTMLIHEAHKKGLQTYISAGLKPSHMLDAVLTGVDGVGIGTSLHYIDPETKLMGALKPEAIREALRIRDEAENSLEGKAAILLARLDRMYYEGSLQQEDDSYRLSLYEAVMARNTYQAEKTMDKLSHIIALPIR